MNSLVETQFEQARNPCIKLFRALTTVLWNLSCRGRILPPCSEIPVVVLQANLTSEYSATPEYKVAIPALKALATAGSLRKSAFKRLLTLDFYHLLGVLEKSGIVSGSTSDGVEFESRAARWYTSLLD